MSADSTVPCIKDIAARLKPDVAALLQHVQQSQEKLHEACLQVALLENENTKLRVLSKPWYTAFLAGVEWTIEKVTPLLQFLELPASMQGSDIDLTSHSPDTSPAVYSGEGTQKKIIEALRSKAQEYAQTMSDVPRVGIETARRLAKAEQDNARLQRRVQELEEKIAQLQTATLPTAEVGIETNTKLVEIEARLKPVQHGKPWRYDSKYPMLLGTTNALVDYELGAINLGRDEKQWEFYEDETGRGSRLTAQSKKRLEYVRALGRFLESCREDMAWLLEQVRELEVKGARLREALEPFSQYAERFINCGQPNEMRILADRGNRVTVEDFRRARTVFSTTAPEAQTNEASTAGANPAASSGGAAGGEL